jgi:hypothetical protein
VTEAAVTDTIRDDDLVLLRLHDDFTVTVAATVSYNRIPDLIADLNRLFLTGQSRGGSRRRPTRAMTGQS